MAASQIKIAYAIIMLSCPFFKTKIDQASLLALRNTSSWAGSFSVGTSGIDNSRIRLDQQDYLHYPWRSVLGHPDRWLTIVCATETYTG